MGFNLIKVQLVGGRTSKRNNGLDFLRLICYIMLSSYHFLNYYGSSYINPLTNGYQAYIIQNFGWGGGRMICNIFLFISAYYFCEKQDFKIQRVLKVWITVLLYSILFGILFFSHSDNQYFLSHLFPISTNVVWYATMYIGIIILSPLLNLLLNEKNRNITSKIVIVLFVLMIFLKDIFPLKQIHLRKAYLLSRIQYFLPI